MIVVLSSTVRSICLHCQNFYELPIRTWIYFWAKYAQLKHVLFLAKGYKVTQQAMNYAIRYRVLLHSSNLSIVIEVLQVRYHNHSKLCDQTVLETS